MKKIILKSFIYFTFLATTSAVFGNITINLNLSFIKDSTGAATPASTLFMLVADTGNNGFGSVSPNTIIGNSGNLTGNQLHDGTSFQTPLFVDGGDDLILWRSDWSDGSATDPTLFDIGQYQDVFNSSGPDPFAPAGSPSSGVWATGNRLAFLWFPELTTGSTMTAAGNSYGLFSPSSTTPGDPSLSGGDPWVTPSDNTSGYELLGFSTDSPVGGPPFFPAPGTVPDLDLQAGLTVVPEPSTYALIIGLAVLIPVVVLHGRRVRKQEEEE